MPLFNNQRRPAQSGAVEGEVLPVQDGAIAAILGAELHSQIAEARRFPRSIERFANSLVGMVTFSQEAAADCIYTLKKGGEAITGPSIRFAEAICSEWGNCKAGSRILGESPDGKFVTAQGVFHDVEKNVMITAEASRSIVTKEGRRYSTDMINTTQMAAQAVAKREAILKGVPKIYWQPAWEAAKGAASGKGKSLGERRSNVIARLRKLPGSPTLEAILAAVGRARVEDVTPEDVEALIGFGTACRDGAPTEEIFPEPKKGPGGEVAP